MDRAATKIQAAYRGWRVPRGAATKIQAAYRGWRVPRGVWEDMFLADKEELFTWNFERVASKIGRDGYTAKDAVNDVIVKWLLRYDRPLYNKLADHDESSQYLANAIDNYQRDRLCAVSQLLSAKGVPRDVFATHCGGLDIFGLCLRLAFVLDSVGVEDGDDEEDDEDDDEDDASQNSFIDDRDEEDLSVSEDH